MFYVENNTSLYSYLTPTSYLKLERHGVPLDASILQNTKC